MPATGKLLQVRSGRVKALGDGLSGIFKTEVDDGAFVSRTGLGGDEHVYHTHGGLERALLHYASSHYADWRSEDPPEPQLFDYGAFGENLVGTNMTEENVCVGDLYRFGKDVVVQVSEPRNPCYKLNIRFKWGRALKRITQTVRVGWLYRVLRTGRIWLGDDIVLLNRPNPQWSLVNVRRVLQAKSVPIPLVIELTELEVVTDLVRDFAHQRLYFTPKTYKLVQCKTVTSRVKHLTFELIGPVSIPRPVFNAFSFAQIRFGPSRQLERSYSIVSGDLNRFSLGIALDDHSRGGSSYLHHALEFGEDIQMTPGNDLKAIEEEDRCVKDECVSKRLVIIGGIGVTAFLPLVEEWESAGLRYRSPLVLRCSKLGGSGIPRSFSCFQDDYLRQLSTSTLVRRELGPWTRGKWNVPNEDLLLRALYTHESVYGSS